MVTSGEKMLVDVRVRVQVLGCVADSQVIIILLKYIQMYLHRGPRTAKD